MFIWTRDSARWFEAAAEHSEFYREIAKRIAKFLPKGSTVCDVGCGIGALALELSKYNYDITAIDVSSLALAALLKKPNKNITPVCADVFSFMPPKPYDAAVFCCFGNPKELFDMMSKPIGKRLFFIESANMHHAFSLTHSPRSQSLAKLKLELDARNIKHAYESFDLEFGQPFISIEDAVAFFRHYDKTTDKSGITMERVAARLIKQYDKKYPYYLPAMKQIHMIVVDDTAAKPLGYKAPCCENIYGKEYVYEAHSV